MNPKVSIQIIFQKDNAYTRESVEHCLQLDYDNYEIILTPDAELSEEFKAFIAPYEHIKVFPEPGNIPHKRNYNASKATGEFLACIDDDAFPEPDWLENAIPQFQDQSIGAVGGPNLTPPHDPLKRQIVGNVLKTKLAFGAGYVRHKKVPKHFINELPTCNLILRTSVVNQIQFDESHTTGEDAKMCLELIERNYKVLYDPTVVVYHHRRTLWKPFLKQFFYYGLFKGKLIKNEKNLHLYYFVPGAFFLFISLGLIASFLHRMIAGIYIIMVVLYAIVTLVLAIKEAKPKEIPYTWLAIFLAQYVYGMGFCRGLINAKLDVAPPNED